MLAQFKESLEIVDAEPVAESTAQRVPSRNLHLICAVNGAEIVTAKAAMPVPHNVAYIKAQETARVPMAGMADNVYAVESAAELADLITLSEPEIAKLQSRLFIEPERGSGGAVVLTMSQSMLPLLQLLAAHSRIRDEPDEPRPLPESWEKRLRTDTVEVPVDTTADDNRCIICAEDRQRSVLFIPCDHLVCCEVCARKLMEAKGECPMCRDPVQDVRRVKKC